MTPPNPLPPGPELDALLAKLDQEERECRDMFHSGHCDGRWAATWQAEIDLRRKAAIAATTKGAAR